MLYRESANDGFHEAVGDTISLSITPNYLQQIGLLTTQPNKQQELQFLLKMALEKIAFLPFALVVDKWRWGVFSGETKFADYNTSWWQLRQQLQRIDPPMKRAKNDFDPGAKYHVPANVPYLRYFLAHILQFQFFQSLCQEANHQGPLFRCSIYNSKAAGKKLNDMLEVGLSQPWQKSLSLVTGSGEMSAKPLLDYFAPLKVWLDQENATADTCKK